MKSWKALIVVLVLVIVGGCAFAMMAPKTESLKYPGKLVKRPAFESEVAEIGTKLKAEVEAFNAKVEIGAADLKRQDERNAKIKTAALEVLAGGVQLATTGNATPAALIGLALQGTLAVAGGTALSKKRSAEQEKQQLDQTLERDTKKNALIVQAVESVRKDPACGTHVKEALAKSINALLAGTNITETEIREHVADAKKANIKAA